jgi:hypothetical protein
LARKEKHTRLLGIISSIGDHTNRVLRKPSRGVPGVVVDTPGYTGGDLLLTDRIQIPLPAIGCCVECPNRGHKSGPRICGK